MKGVFGKNRYTVAMNFITRVDQPLKNLLEDYFLDKVHKHQFRSNDLFHQYTLHHMFKKYRKHFLLPKTYELLL